MESLLDDIQSVLYSAEDIRRRVKELGTELSSWYRDEVPLVVGILKGASYFLADLTREMPIPLEIDYMVVSSYGTSTRSSGVVRILKDLDYDISGRHVLLVEDIIDTGLTLRYLVDILARRDPKSLKIVTLLDKPARRKVDLVPDLVGFTAPDEFLVGYGLDYAERYRNLPFVGILKSRVYAEKR
ncbi:MAG: Hypoxanthine-guanine phosphoribosyltransferase [Brockia lithotrophica]|uniref:Hypoxanthine phosphoribosyltransferase n=1 Tax=Brockia lithotrophica TaxID=933949 RepID=A0A2T5G546_9BACL|nr:hypoxanthine phosphoribosyltransferase [Brockia lithotrophica]MBT9253775.1 hypoxanthine phosphoribosyltransferase [Brockia lithotrophica]PTQ51298.1 MAG: Hypoxanthine-guanine phosphoribosyltransferase [Brockia lithotrophica]